MVKPKFIIKFLYVVTLNVQYKKKKFIHTTKNFIF